MCIRDSTTALLRDCADYITAVVIQNGGYSSKLSKEENAVEMHEEIFQFAADNNVALWFFQGVNDFISPPLTAEVMYEAFVNDYKAAGKDTEWLEDNVRFTYLNDKLYTDMNESSFHSTMTVSYTHLDVYKRQGVSGAQGVHCQQLQRGGAVHKDEFVAGREDL